MGDIVPFSRPPVGGGLLYTLQIYDTPDQTDVVVSRADGEEPDPADVVTRLQKLIPFIYEDLYSRSGDQDHELKLTMRVFGSSKITCTWTDDDMESPEGLAWLHRRFGDAYWNLDQRRGIAYHWHILRGKLRNFIRHQPKDTNPK